MRAGKSNLNYRISVFALVLMLAALFFAVRIRNTETLVTNDEPFWLGRSANFYRALTYRDFEHTYQMAHPGVPVMWAGTIAFGLHAPEYVGDDPDNTEWPFFIDGRLTAAGIDPLTILQHARIVKLVFETTIFAIAVGLIARLGTFTVAAVAGVLITLDPFLAGFGPLLHVDSLFAMSLFAASLAIAWMFTEHSRDRSVWYVCILAGGLAALAVLTRTTGLIIAIPLLLGAFMRWWAARSNETNSWKFPLSRIGVWIIGFVAAFVIAWPAIWVAPVSTARNVIAWTLGAASDGHEHALFFNGAIQQSDPGFWFYPVTLLWRTTPLIWIGLVLFVVSLRCLRTREQIRIFMPVIVTAASVFVMMTLGAKKFDRYILPVYPVVSLIVALGFAYVIDEVRIRFTAVRFWLTPAALAGLAVIGAISFAGAGPYRLNYYNEIMRSFRDPEQVLQIGWGEGGAEVIAWLEEESERLGRPVTVQTFSIPTESIPPPLKYFLLQNAAPTMSIQFHNIGLTKPDDWASTDYYVFNIQQTQRDMVPDYAYFIEYEPVFTVSYGGIPIWEVYSPNQLPIPESIPDT